MDATFVELPYDGLFNRLSSEFSSGNVSFDVAALDSVWLPNFKDAVQPIDELFTDEAKKDIFPALVKEAQVDGHFVGMPVWTNAEILFYRKDLFEDAKNKADFKAKYGYDLAAPTTWEQYQDIAEFFTKDGMYGTDVKGARRDRVAGPRPPGRLTDGPRRQQQRHHRRRRAPGGARLLHQPAQVAPAGAAQVDWAAAQNLFNQGKTAMTRFWAHAYRQIPKDAPVFGKVGAAPMIGGTAGVAGVPGPWYLSVPTATKNAEIAKKFIKFAYDHNDLGHRVHASASPRASRPSRSTRTSPGTRTSSPLLETLNGDATATRPATAKWQQIVDTVLVPMLQKAVAGADNAALLAEAKKQDRGPRQVRLRGRRLPEPVPAAKLHRSHQQKRNPCASPIAASPCF